MASHEAGHEALLEAILTGADEAGELRGQLAGCARCERKLAELELAAELATLDARAEGLGAETWPAFAAGEEAGRRRLLELAAAEFGAHPAPHEERARPLLLRALPALLVAAAILAFAALRLFGGGGEVEPSGETYLGTDALEFLLPAADTVARDALVFAWSGELEGTDEFLLHIEDEHGGDVPPAPLRLLEARWEPEFAVVKDWPEVVKVRVEVVSFFGQGTRTSPWRTLRLER